MFNSFISSIFNMKADIYVQENSQSSSGAVTRKWIYNSTTPCKIMAIQGDSGSTKGDNKTFSSGVNSYQEDLHLKMQSPIKISKRHRVSSIRSNDDKKVFIELDKYSEDDTVYEIVSSHAVLDPFGRISYYEINLRRAVIQNNDTTEV